MPGVFPRRGGNPFFGGNARRAKATKRARGGFFTQAETRRWRGVPHGTQVCDGVTFICNGAIRTAGLQSARDDLRYPGAVLGVPVRGRGSRLHLLHAAENTSDMLDVEPYGRLVLHYANGET